MSFLSASHQHDMKINLIQKTRKHPQTKLLNDGIGDNIVVDLLMLKVLELMMPIVKYKPVTSEGYFMKPKIRKKKQIKRQSPR